MRGEVASDRNFSLGIDIGGTKAHGLVLDANDRIVGETIHPTQPTESGIRRTVADVANELARSLGLNTQDFTSVGLGIPGLVDPDTGVVETAVNLQITRSDLGKVLADLFGVPVRVENDLKATAMGVDLALGATHRSLTYVNLGTGLATATITDGRLLRGEHNWAGELGHLSLTGEGAECPCGQHGCLETVLGGGNLAPRLAAFDLELAHLDTDSQPAAIQERNRLVAALTQLFSIVAVSYDPEIVVIGGGVINHASWLIQACREELQRRANGSAFLTRLDIAGRIRELPDGVPVAALGTAIAGRSSNR